MADQSAAAYLRPTDLTFDRYRVDLTTQTVQHERRACADLEDALGGIARGFKLLYREQVADPYDPSAPLVMNIGALTGTRVMTGLRTYLIGYSPLKASLSGAPALMWSAGSGSFGTRLRSLGIEEIVFTGRAARPDSLAPAPRGGRGPGPLRLPRRRRPARPPRQRTGPPPPRAHPRGALRRGRPGRRALPGGGLRRGGDHHRPATGDRRCQAAVVRAGRVRRGDGVQEPAGRGRRRPQSPRLGSRAQGDQPGDQPGGGQRPLPGPAPRPGRHLAHLQDDEGRRSPARVQLPLHRHRPLRRPLPGQRGGRALRGRGPRAATSAASAATRTSTTPRRGSPWASAPRWTTSRWRCSAPTWGSSTPTRC